MPRITPPKPTSTSTSIDTTKDTSAICFYYITPTLTVQRQPLTHTKYIKLAEDLKKVHNHFTSPEQAGSALAEIRKLYRNPHLIEDCHQSIALAEHKLQEARIAYTEIKAYNVSARERDNEWVRQYRKLEKSLPSPTKRNMQRFCVAYTVTNIILYICLALFLYVQ